MSSNQFKDGKHGSQTLALAVSAVLTFALFAGAAFVGYMHHINSRDRVLIDGYRRQIDLAREQWAQLDQAEDWLAEENYSACAGVAVQLAKSSIFPERVTALSDRCYTPWAEDLLEQAQSEAKAGELKIAIKTVSPIKYGMLETKAQQSIAEWSKRILEMAHDQYHSPSNQLNSSLKMLQAIPWDSPLSEESRALADQWRSEWEDNARYERLAHSALAADDPSKASKFAEEISSHLAWTTKKDKLVSEVEKLKQRHHQLALQAERLAQAEAAKPASGLQPVIVSIAAALVVVSLVRR
ncbi:MAG: hypothetical protein AAF716_04420 [Cyanobacteria bacterium P01_D01_bin.1]